MTLRKSKLVILGAMALSLLSTGATQAQTTINFNSYAPGTPISSLDGVSFSLQGNPGPDGTPVIGIGFTGGLANTTSGNYPTAEDLTFDFSTPSLVSSFSVNEYDYNPSASWTAYSSTHALLGTGALDGTNWTTYTPDVADVSSLTFDNGLGSFRSWEFVVGDITFTPSAAGVPDGASTIGLLGFALVGLGVVRRKLNV